MAGGVSTRRRPAQLLLISVLFLLSGATALVYQVTWLRNLTLIIGASFQATSILLASFMAGLGLGGLVAGRLSERVARPLRVYGMMEIGIAGFALVLPLLLTLADDAYVRWALAAGGATPALNFVRSAMSFAILLLPTVLMGATLPVLTTALVGHHGEFGRRFSWLYGVNTLGAVVGAVATGFVLLPTFGVWTTQLLAAAVNVAIGCTSLALSPLLTPAGSALPAVGEEAAADASPAHAGADPPPALPLARRVASELAFAGAAVSGLCALALEVMWTRALSIAVGTTTYSFTVMLASFLIGIWLGSWLHSAIQLRRVPVHVQLGAVFVVIGIASIGASLVIARLPDLVVELNVWLYGVAPRIGFGTILLGGFGVMLVPCVFMGIAFPLSGEARAQLGRSFGRSAGDTLGWNTLGSVAGSLLTGFVLIPTLGLQRGMLLAASIYVAYGCLVLAAPLVAGARGARWRRVLPASVGAALVAGAALWLPSRLSTWDVRSLGGFQNNKLDDYVSGAGEVNVRERLDEVVVRHYLEGRASTVSVVDAAGDFALLVNGKAVASDNSVDIHHLLMLGHLPILTHPAPKRALVIGMGAGFTLGSVTAHPELDAVKLVEIEPAILAAQPFYAGVDGDPLSDPRLTVEFQDARNYLKTTSERFDVITSDPIHPWNAGSGYLYTVEFYSMARQALNPGGILCQWVPIYGLSIANFKSIVATFDAAFEHTMIWQMGYDAALVGSAEPFEIDFEDLGRRLSQPSVRSQLEEIGLADPHAFLAELAVDPGASSDYARGGIVNTDDNLYVEFSSPASHGTPEIWENADRINEYRRRPYLDPSFLAISETERRTLDLHRKAQFETLEIFFDGQSPEERAKKVQQVLETMPGYRPAEIMLARIRNNLALTLLNAGMGQAAVQAAEQAVALDPRNAAAHRTLGTALLIVGRYADAVAELERSLALRPGRWRDLVLLSVALEGEGRNSEALQALRAAIAINPHDPELAERLESLAAAG